MEGSSHNSNIKIRDDILKEVNNQLYDMGLMSHDYNELLLKPQDAINKNSFIDSNVETDFAITNYSEQRPLNLGFGNTRWITFNVRQIDLLTRSNPHIKNAINYLSTLPLINGIDINSPKDELSSEELFTISEKFRSLYRASKDTLSKSYAYGGAAALICFTTDTDESLSRPLLISEIRKGSFVGLKPLARWYSIEPAIEKGLITRVGLGTGFDSADVIGLPEYYWVNITGGLMGNDISSNRGVNRTLVHSSRLFLMNTELPSVIETQIERYWGASLIELMYNDLIQDRRLWAATVKSAEKNNIGIMKVRGLGLSATLNEAVRKRISARIGLIKEASSHNVLPIDEQDSFEFASAVLSGQADILKISNSRLAGSAGVPTSVMFAGDGGDNEDRLYIQSRTKAQDVQERILRPGYETLLKVIAKSELGRQVKSLTFTFNPIETQTLEDKAEMFVKMTSSLKTLYDIGFDKSSIIGMLDDAGKDPINISQNINPLFRDYIFNKAKNGEFETKNSDQILVAEALNQVQMKNQENEVDESGKRKKDKKNKKGLSGVHSPESDIGGQNGGDPTTSQKPLNRNVLNREKSKKQ